MVLSTLLLSFVLLRCSLGFEDIDDDGGYDTLPCGPLGQDVVIWSEEDIATAGTGQWVAIVPDDGKRFANGYQVEDPSQNRMVGFRAHTYVYAEGLRRWVEDGVDPIQVDYDDESFEGGFWQGSYSSMKMTRGLLAVGTSQTTYDIVGTVLDTDGYVELWSWAGSSGRGKQTMGWIPYSHLKLKPTSGQGKSSTGLHIYGRIFDLAETDSYEARLALGMPINTDGPTTYDDDDDNSPDESVGEVEVYDFRTYEDERPSHWEQAGQTLLGTGPDFGQQVAMSRDGQILAVLATAISPTPRRCEVQIYKLSEEDATATSWNLLGEPIVVHDESENMICSNMVLSGDGKTLGLGPRLYSYKYDEAPMGHVQLWSYQDEGWKRKGSDIDSIIRLPDERSFTFGRELSMSFDGSRLVVSSSQSLLKNSSPEYGVFYVLEWNEDLDDWKQYGGPVETMEKSFSQSMSLSDDGETLVVGLPDGADFRGVVQPYDCFGYGVLTTKTKL